MSGEGQLFKYMKTQHAAVAKTLSSSGFLRYFKNTGWMMVERIIRLLSGLLVGVLIARYLGPESFGLLCYILAFVTILAGVAKLGLDGVLVQELIKNDDKQEVYLGSAFWLRVMGACLVVLLISALVYFIPNESNTKFYILLASVGIFFQSFEVIDLYFQSKVNIKILSFLKIIQIIILSLIKLCLIYSEADLTWFVFVFTFESLILMIVYIITYRNIRKMSFIRCFDFDVAKSLIEKSWPLMLSALVVMVYMRVDQLMINQMLGEYELGIYSVAVRVSEVFYFIPVVITASLFPAIVNAKSKNEKVYRDRFKKLYRLLFLSSILISVTIFFLAERVIVLLFGDVFKASADVLIIHTWATFFVFIGVAGGKWYISEGLQRIALVNSCVGAGLNIALNAYLIPLYGIEGSAYATVISYSIAAYFMNFVWKKTRPNFMLQTKCLIGV